MLDEIRQCGDCGPMWRLLLENSQPIVPGGVFLTFLLRGGYPAM